MWEKKYKQTTSSSRQACFVIAHSSVEIIKTIFLLRIPSRLYTIKFKCFSVKLLRSNALLLWRQEDTSLLCLLSDDRSGQQIIKNFSLRQRLPKG